MKNGETWKYLETFLWVKKKDSNSSNYFDLMSKWYSNTNRKVSKYEVFSYVFPTFNSYKARKAEPSDVQP